MQEVAMCPGATEPMDKVQEVLKEVSENHMVSIDELTGPSRAGDIVLARKDAYKKLEQAGFGRNAIGRALHRDPSTVTRGLVEPPKECPRGHGPLRRDPEGIAVCITCGHAELPEQPAMDESDPGKGKYTEAIKIQAVRDVEQGADKAQVCKRVRCHSLTLDAWMAKYGRKTDRGGNANGEIASKMAAGRRVRGKAIPEEIKIQAVKEYEAGGDPEKIAERVGCSPDTIKTSWFNQYSRFRERESSIEVIDVVLRGLYNERWGLNKQLSDLNHRIAAFEMAKGILETV